MSRPAAPGSSNVTLDVLYSKVDSGCVPGSMDKRPARCRLWPDIVCFSNVDEAELLRASRVGRVMWLGESGITRRKKPDTQHMEKVETARSRRRSDVLSGNARDDIVEKKNALRPKPESGKAVAVPRLFGQLRAAGQW